MRTPSNHPRAAPAAAAAIERLEQRQLMASVSLYQGVLSVTGDAPSRNTINVSLSSDRTRLLVTTNGTTRSFAVSQVGSLRLTGGNVQDVISVAPNVTTRATLIGGSGNDVFRGGGGNDSVNGGSGDDWIDGGPGYDRTDGSTGADTYVNDTKDSPSLASDDFLVRAQPPFPTYDAMSFLNKPNTAAYGMKPIFIAYTQFFANGDYSKPDEASTRAFARSMINQGKPVVIDIEDWPIDIRYATDAQVNDSITKLGQIVDWMHSEAPGVKVGFYGVLPIQDFWTPVQYQHYLTTDPTYAQQVWLPKYQAWQAANDKLKPLAAKVDFLFPSLYTFYDDPAGWKTYATANLSEARRYGKPVYPFLWMYYHDSNATLKGQLIPRDYWQLELDTVRRQANGTVVWGGWQTPWTGSNADWWTLTTEFIRRQQAAQ